MKKHTAKQTTESQSTTITYILHKHRLRDGRPTECLRNVLQYNTVLIFWNPQTALYRGKTTLLV